ncbi:unnamed protein product [Urochloa humidicola]
MLQEGRQHDSGPPLGVAPHRAGNARPDQRQGRTHNTSPPSSRVSPGAGYLSHAINLYLRYKPPVADLKYFLDFQYHKM